MSRYTPDAAGFTDFLLEHHGAKIRYVPEDDRFYKYDEARGMWHPGTRQQVEIGSVILETYRFLYKYAETFSDRDAAKLAKFASSTPGNRAVVSMLKNDRRTWASFKAFIDASPYMVNFSDCTVDLSVPAYGPDWEAEYNVRKHSPEYKLTHVIKSPYEPFADHSYSTTPLWTSVLSHMCGGSADMMKNLEEALAYGMIGENPEQYAVFLVGAPNTGKTQTLEIVTELLGDLGGHGKIELITSSKGYGSEHDSLRASLRGKRFVMLGETGAKFRLDDIKFKDLTGSKSVPTRRLGQEQVDTPVTWTLYAATNELPELSSGGMDDATARRLWIFDLPGQQLTEDERDVHLTAKIIRQEGTHILNRLAVLASALMSSGVKRGQHSIDALDRYRSDYDSVKLFCQDQLTHQDGGYVTYNDLYAQYTDFCKKQGMGHVSRRVLPKQCAEFMEVQRDIPHSRLRNVAIAYGAPSWA